MALGYIMRIYAIALSLLFAGCATAPKDTAKSIKSLSTKTLAAGECGLYVWTADDVKTFTLFAAPGEVSYLKDSKAISLTEKNPTTPPASNREFIDETGTALRLTLLSPEEIEGGTRYKSGRLTGLSDDGWEKVVPIVGLYACQPVA